MSAPRMAPGPWKLVERATCYEILSRDRDVIATLPKTSGLDEAEAAVERNTAAAIAAVPELVANLRGAAVVRARVYAEGLERARKGGAS